MSNPITLLAEERPNGRERLCVRWVEGDHGGRLDICIEKRDGENWVRGYGVGLSPGEVLRLHDAAGQATWLVRQARR